MRRAPPNRLLIWSGLWIQVAFLIYWIFSCPKISAQLEIARRELKWGDADVPALTLRRTDAEQTTVNSDPSKSTAENLEDRAMLRIAAAERGFRSIVAVPLLVTLANAMLLIMLLITNRRRHKKHADGTSLSSADR
jgi:hypothetical protein